MQPGSSSAHSARKLSPTCPWATKVRGNFNGAALGCVVALSQRGLAGPGSSLDRSPLSSAALRGSAAEVLHAEVHEVL